MLFNSLTYVFFLPIVFAIYWLLPNKYRWCVLLISSYYFYMSWNAKYVILILFTTALSYCAALIIEKAVTKRIKKAILCGTSLCLLLVLFFFKYYNFAIESFSGLLSHFSIKFSPIMLNVLLPVGISFYTFQTLSYVIDVYYGKIRAEKNFGIYATFVSFFPQLVAGPIERTSNLLPQIKAKHFFNEKIALEGTKLMLWGYFKKLIIADRVAQYVDIVYGDLTTYSGFDLVLTMFFFTLQIYCDFSGYSDIAIGTAKLLDINLITNFQSPYFSSSVKEFWSRWHISLSTWFKDYVYIPLGGNKCTKLRSYLNLLITFLVSGLWHGANWTFVLWGGLHGTIQLFEKIFDKKIKKIRRNKMGHVVSVIVVFCLCNFAWVFFRSETISDALYVIRNAFVGIANPSSYFRSRIITPIQLISLFVHIFILAMYDFMNYKNNTQIWISNKNKCIQWIFYISIGLIIVFASVKGVPTEFVYFQF